MSTSCMIGMVEADGSVSAIYCHWDGYLSHAGMTLDKHYVSDVQISKLIAIGDLSSLSIAADDPGTKVSQVQQRAFERFGSISEYRRELGSNGDQYRYLWDGEAWFYISKKQDAWDDVREGMKDILLR